MNTRLKLSRRAAPVVVALLLLGGMAADRVRLGAPGVDARAYHERIRTLADSVPYRVGDWVGQDKEVPLAATRSLKPNLLVSREYQHLHTGEKAGLLIVQCTDARDLLGHYPPVCYVGSGWTRDTAHRRDWLVADRGVRSTQYMFTRQAHGRTTGLHVTNFMLLPGGGTAPDMDAVSAVAQDRRRKLFGAAQVQVLTDGEMSRTTRERIVRRLIEANMTLFDAICSSATTSNPHDHAADGPRPASAPAVTAAVGATHGDEE